MPDNAPGLLGFVGPVDVPPDPPALLLPNPALGLTPDVAPGVAVGDPTGPPLGAGTGVPGPLAPCCANTAPLVPASNNAERMKTCLLLIHYALSLVPEANDVGAAGVPGGVPIRTR
jgi:hypothetical protein